MNLVFCNCEDNVFICFCLFIIKCNELLILTVFHSLDLKDVFPGEVMNKYNVKYGDNVILETHWVLGPNYSTNICA